MVFSSLMFLFIFLPIFLGCYFLTPIKYRNAVLFLASLLFYSWGEPIYVGIMIFSTVWDYSLGRGISLMKNKSQMGYAKTLLILSVFVNIGMLCFFKYSNFFIDNINNLFGFNYDFIKIALPIGISFYTFQTMSYTIDVYRGKVAAQKNIISFGAYVSMFPQLIAGPIVKYSVVEKELNERAVNIDCFGQGIERFIEGLGKKVLIANNIGLLWDTITNTISSDMSVMLYWMGAFAFGMQLYYDFSGYSDMAIGLGKMMGFNFPENFNYPYMSKSVSEFWRRWHITLGSWFKEYVYIPLGGNRVSNKRIAFNLLIVWFLTGFWHGAGWNFVLWGLYFCFWIIVEKFCLSKILLKLNAFVSWLYCILIVFFGWVLFAIEDISLVWEYVLGMFGQLDVPLIDENAIYLMGMYLICMIVAIVFATPIPDRLFRKSNSTVRLVIYMVILVLVTAYLVDASFNPFLYFRF